MTRVADFFWIGGNSPAGAGVDDAVVWGIAAEN
jgi:hypothetical protein